jgi:hypothetical protein
MRSQIEYWSYRGSMLLPVPERGIGHVLCDSVGY